ncbi:oxalurate catabolism protein HpxX [Erwinia sp. P6884]|uniref:oxalurate catabolism protein HpxX n=1 Tax=Erwinia sp. P6884 TaxID=3141450 RepID=UPI00318B1207
MTHTSPDWATWLVHMEQVMGVTLDDERRAELHVQFTRIAAMAEPLMAFPLDDRQEVAGIYKA